MRIKNTISEIKSGANESVKNLILQKSLMLLLKILKQSIYLIFIIYINNIFAKIKIFRTITKKLGSI
jgi:hypothetical protein